MNHKRLRRLYREDRLQVRRRSGRKRALGTRSPITIPQGANQRWSLDFLSDGLADGRPFRILAIVDDFTRECLALVADTSLPGLRVVRELDALIIARGGPTMIVSDKRHGADQHGGPALVARAAGGVALRRLPALNLPYNSLSTVWRQTGILVHVHPVLPWNLKSQQPQPPRSEPDGQPVESSHLGKLLRNPNWLLGSGFCRSRCWLG